MNGVPMISLPRQNVSLTSNDLTKQHQETGQRGGAQRDAMRKDTPLPMHYSGQKGLLTLNLNRKKKSNLLPKLLF